MKFKRRNSLSLGDLVCGNLGADNPGPGDEPRYFPYPSSSIITEFFADLGTDWVHDGTTRNWWIADRIDAMLAEPHDGPTHPPEIFCRLIDQLMDPRDALSAGGDRPMALAQLNDVLSREGFEAFYGEDRHCYLRHVGSDTVTVLQVNPHRPLTAAETQRRADLSAYLDICSEDELIEEVLLPLFRQLGFHRITAAGHKDKALEYGKDIWMRHTLPTQHQLYFGIQVKKGELDSSGVTKTGNANIAEIHNQVLMMLAHEIFDPNTIGGSWSTTRSSSPAARSPSRPATGWATLSTPPNADHVHRPRRHRRPQRRHQPATTCRSTAARPLDDQPWRRPALLAVRCSNSGRVPRTRLAALRV